MAKKRKKNRRRKILFLVKNPEYYDYNLLASVILLMCFGLVMLYSTSAYSAQLDFGNDMEYFSKQAVISAVCIVIAIGVSQFDYHLFAKFAGILYVISNILLFLTKFIGTELNGAKRWIYFGPISFQPAEMAKVAIILFLPVVISNILLFLTKFIGTELNGAKRWIYFGPISFQPAEMAKVAIILFLPVLITKMGSKVKTWQAFWTILLSGALTSFLTLAFTDNLSTAIIIAGITVGLLFIVFPKNMPFIVGGAGVAAVAVGVVYYASKVVSSENFRLRRIMVWLNPEANESVGGYQVMQGLYAIGSGRLFGKGLGNSLQKLDYVPEAQNDMIFSIICEELGIFGAVMMCLLFAFMLYRLVFIAQNAPDLLGSLIAAGVFIHIALQVVLNIAVVTNAIPTTGITLPFISYGGTSILFLMAEMALALSVSRQIRFHDEGEKQ